MLAAQCASVLSRSLADTAFLESQRRDAGEARSELEKQVELERLESGVNRGLKVSAMGLVPFPSSPQLTAALTAFAAGSLASVEIVRARPRARVCV